MSQAASAPLKSPRRWNTRERLHQAAASSALPCSRLFARCMPAIHWLPSAFLASANTARYILVGSVAHEWHQLPAGLRNASVAIKSRYAALWPLSSRYPRAAQVSASLVRLTQGCRIDACASSVRPRIRQSNKVQASPLYDGAALGMASLRLNLRLVVDRPDRYWLSAVPGEGQQCSYRYLSAYGAIGAPTSNCWHTLSDADRVFRLP